jgi:hypothetical protein
MSFMAIYIHEVIYGPECGREEHHSYRYPGEVSRPIEEESYDSDGDDDQQASHHGSIILI